MLSRSLVRYIFLDLASGHTCEFRKSLCIPLLMVIFFAAEQAHSQGYDPVDISWQAWKSAQTLQYQMRKEARRRLKVGGPDLRAGTRSAVPTGRPAPFSFKGFDFHATEYYDNVQGILERGYIGYPWSRSGWIEASHGPYVIAFDDFGFKQSNITAVLAYAEPGDEVRLVWLNDANPHSKSLGAQYADYLIMLQEQRNLLSMRGQRVSLTPEERYAAGGPAYARAVEERFDRRFGDGSYRYRMRLDTAKQFGVGFGSGFIGAVAGRYIGDSLTGGDTNWQNVGGAVGSEVSSTLSLTAWAGEKLTLANIANNAKGGFAFAVPINAAIEMSQFIGLRPQWLGGKGWFQSGAVDYDVFQERTLPNFQGGLLADTGSYLSSALNAFSDPVRTTWNIADSLVNPYAYYVDITGEQPGRTLIGSGARTFLRMQSWLIGRDEYYDPDLWRRQLEIIKRR